METLLTPFMRGLAVAALGGLGCLVASCADSFSSLVPPTVDEDPTLPAIDINQTRLHLTTQGDPSKPTVIMLHGGPGGDHRSLGRLGAIADDGYFVVQFDQRGTGLSRRHGCDRAGSAEYLADLEAIVDRFAPAPRPVLFIGHSWGAMYATWYINEHPTRVTSAVLLEPGGFKADEVGAYMQRLIGGALFSESLNDATFTGRMLTPDDHERADLLTATLFASTADVMGKSHSDPEPFWRAGGVASRCVQASNSDFDFTTRLSAFRREVLFVRGDQNEAMPEETQRRLAADYPKSRLVTLPGVGHDLHWVKAGEVRALAREHFARALSEVSP